MRKQKGFSLIELLIVVAIILIIAAIAIPNLLKARTSANEASAVGNVRTMVTAEATYQIDYQKYGTSADLVTAKLIDSTLGNTTNPKSGYIYVATAPNTNADFFITATPKSTTDGNRKFCAYTDGALHQDTASPTSAVGDGATCQGLPGVK